ncbi:ABC transporter substrate-binding protein [Candidatus Leptofilum sp.]|uniref:ABC transporter substrate-binding protein n=1 Tax=Candidatus Leptofilum sp. TaxID=3241576 RepID=UPI003B5939AA
MRKLTLIFLFALIALFAIACGERPQATETDTETDTDTATETTETSDETADSSDEEMADEAAGSFLERAKAGEFTGSEVTVFGKWTEAEGESFEAALAPFEEATGIDVKYEGSSEFETLITVRVEGGDAPDIAGFPQPGLMAQFVREGAIPDHAQFLDTSELSANYSDAWINLATVNNQLSGVFYRASTKSIVWYPVQAFADAGYAVPQTWDEMIALSDQIVADGGTPWCVSMEHGGVTGWVATDWVEDVLLRTAPPETYDQWVNHEIPFNDPAVVNAANIVGDIWFNEDYVYGGTTGILTIWVGDTQTPMFDDAGPQCWMHRQAGWIPDFWPEGTEAGVDSSFFYLPPIDEAYGNPVLGGGDVFSAFNTRPETAALMEYLSLPEGAEVWVKAGGFISPNRNVPADWYANYVDQAQAEILQGATTLRFDASDLMPAEVGAGTFWSGMVDWVGGADTETVFQNIENSWPDAETGLGGTGDAEEEAAEEAGGYEHLARAEAGEFAGTEVTIFGKWTEGEEDSFVNTLADFEERTGIDIKYEGSSEFETLITVRVEGGDAPDIAGFPQPGLLAEFVREGAVVDLGTNINTDQLAADYSNAWIDLATVDGQLSGVFFRASTKSIVWYPVQAFEDAGYEIPETWDEMIALSDQIVADGGTPWCVSMEHGGVTGWVATDWVEDVLLRTASPEVYDQWVNHEIPFNAPEVVNAANIVGDIWFNEDYVYGGTIGILTIWVGDTQTPMFDEAGPQCWMHRQAGWIPDFWPEGTEAGVDSSFFYLPPIDEAYGRPVLGGGDVFAAFADRPEVLAVMEYLATADAAKGWVEAGGFISPNRSVPADWYGSYVDQGQAEILQGATTLRFDASDLMPAEVGAGTFWSGMVDWVSGTDTETVLQQIEDSWPEN